MVGVGVINSVNCPGKKNQGFWTALPSSLSQLLCSLLLGDQAFEGRSGRVCHASENITVVLSVFSRNNGAELVFDWPSFQPRPRGLSEIVSNHPTLEHSILIY